MLDVIKRVATNAKPVKPSHRAASFVQAAKSNGDDLQVEVARLASGLKQIAVSMKEIESHDISSSDELYDVLNEAQFVEQDLEAVFSLCASLRGHLRRFRDVLAQKYGVG
jgi:hypothetical protein